MTIKRITIILTILGSTMFASLSFSIHAKSATVQAARIDSAKLEAGSSVSFVKQTGSEIRPSTLSNQERDQLLASTVEFRYIYCTGYNKMHAGLGTKVNEHTVLTHNHFGNQANFCMLNPSAPAQQVDIAIKQDSRAIGHGDQYGDQTLLVDTTEEIQGPAAALASQQLISAMAVGEVVELVYWDDENSELAVASFQISGFLGDSVLVLDDSSDIINKGDSGGGVFYQGALVGNTWRYLPTFDQNGNLIDKQVHVHLIPMDVRTP
jgi:hypothetical protein